MNLDYTVSTDDVELEKFYRENHNVPVGAKRDIRDRFRAEVLE